MKHWMRMGVAALVASLMMGYGQVSAQVQDTTYERVGSIRPMQEGEVGVPLGEYLAMEKKKKQERKKTSEEKAAEFVAMLNQNPLVDLRQTIGPEITVKQLSSSKLAQVGEGYVVGNLGSMGTTVARVKYYTGLEKMKAGLNLGHYMDVYELQGTDQYGLNTAWVLVFPLPKEWLIAPESYGKEGLSTTEMNTYTNDMNALLKYFKVNIGEDKDINYSQGKVPAKLQLRNVEPLHTLTDSKYGTMTTAGTITYDIKGIQYPAYLRIALVGTPNYFTAIVMGTSEVEGTFFKPYFLQMLQHIK